MQVAAIYDIHGNLPALEVVLEEIVRADVDLVVVGGDVVPGPMPAEVIEALRALDLPKRFILGNTDREVLAQCDGTTTPWYRSAPEQWREPVTWSALQLSADDAALLREFEDRCVVEIGGIGSVCFCHATPQSDDEVFTRQTAESLLLSRFEGHGYDMVVCGHTHMQFERAIGRTRVVNAGSVGMPFGPPGAYWLLLGPEARLQKTPFDLASAAERVKATDYPQADQFAENHVVSPPSESKMLDLFSRAELS